MKNTKYRQLLIFCLLVISSIGFSYYFTYKSKEITHTIIIDKDKELDDAEKSFSYFRQAFNITDYRCKIVKSPHISLDCTVGYFGHLYKINCEETCTVKE